MSAARIRVVLCVAALGCGGEQADRVDLLLLGGSVYTLDWPSPSAEGRPSPASPWTEAHGWRPAAQALVVDAGWVLWIGSDADAEVWRDRAERVIDLAGAAVVPGLVDSHVHLLELGAKLSLLDLTGVASELEAVERVAARAAETPAGSWIVGQGWDEGAWADRYPDHGQLSERVPNHPVLLRGLHGFAAWGNRLAFERAGIDAMTPDPVGGRILRDDAGEPSGIVLNRAVPLLERALPEPTDSAIDARVLGALERMASSGYTGVHDAGTPAKVVAALERLEAAGRLPIRVHVMLSARDTALLSTWRQRGPDGAGRLRVRAVKAYYDGALGSRGARLLEEYTDQPGHRGVAGEGYGFDVEAVLAMAAAGFQLGVHAIGDAGNRETLDLLERIAGSDSTARAARHRIEHAQVVHTDDFARFGRLGLIASMQPPHAVEDMPWAESRLGASRLVGAYAWRTMLRTPGVTLLFNSDLPGSDHDIFYGLHSAVTRRDRSLRPDSGWRVEETVTIEEAVRAYSTAAAYAEFREVEAGVIAIGRVADLTVLEPDPFRAEPARLLTNGRVVLTIVDGRIVHEAGSR